MAILDFIRNDRKTVKNAVQINEVRETPNFITPYAWCHNHKSHRVGDTYLQAIFNVIWKGISNITFKDNGKDLFTPQAICKFIDANAVLLVNQYIYSGYICVFYDKDKNYRIPTNDEIKLDRSGRIINKAAVVYYSPQYQSTGERSLFKISEPIVGLVNKMAGSEEYLTDTLGCVGILTGQEVGATNELRKKFLENFKGVYGIGEDKYNFILSSKDIKYIPLNPDIKGLGFQEKMKELYKVLANLYGVPLPLLFDESSTYNNVKEARTFFYNNTIRYYAEILLKVARELLTASNEFIPQSSITYKLENVPEIEITLSAACQERMSYLEYLLKLKEAGLDVEKQLIELQQESKSLLSEV